MKANIIYILLVSLCLSWAYCRKSLTIHIIPYSYNEMFETSTKDKIFDQHVKTTLDSVNKYIYEDFLSNAPKNRTFHYDNLYYLLKYLDTWNKKGNQKIIKNLTCHMIFEQNLKNSRLVLTNGGMVNAGREASHKENFLNYRIGWEKSFEYLYDELNIRPNISWQMQPSAVSLLYQFCV